MKLNPVDGAIIEGKGLDPGFVSCQTGRDGWQFGDVVVVVHERVEGIGQVTEQWIGPPRGGSFDPGNRHPLLRQGRDPSTEQVGDELVAEANPEGRRSGTNGPFQVLGERIEPGFGIADPGGRPGNDNQVEVDMVGEFPVVWFEPRRGG